MVASIRAILGLLVMLINTLIGIGPMMVIALAKLIVPHQPFQQRCARGVMWIAEKWVDANVAVLNRMLDTRWELRGDFNPRLDTSYLVLCNHQSWVDIAALVEVLNGRVPYYKFFLKRELIWVPLLGLAFWALDYPLMRRYSSEYLKKHPEKRGLDLEITRKACEKCRGMPITVVNFPEGTRYTPAKHEAQQPGFRHLLQPKAGGISFVLASIGDQIDTILDISIVYPDGVPGFWDLLANRIPRVIVDIRQYPLDQQWVRGDYRNDPAFRSRFQQWITELWQQKDERIGFIHTSVDAERTE
ncbi:acyltransferase [Halovibrio salipaludis]|uniref:Acyltransferase n=1 Tax=Halovibrio salipaludis TaxID=2032626 RepID=A0A2A2FBT9_9GAMM|nr:acyltransferase [Halovibrio salipaludis]PAU82055.1 acyltransferase [Halovibrio salipaludis]